MTNLPSEIDVAIIGAGAAGLGAARALENSGLSVIVLEARDRIGGRARTVMAAPGIPFDMGCGWLHSADQNSFVAIAGRLGVEIDKTRAPWRQQSYDRSFSKDDRASFFAASDAFYERAERAAEHGPDAPASTCLEPGNRWNPMLDAISTYINGVELDHVSLHDMDAYENTEVNWRLPSGYGALIAAYGAPCPVSLNTEVSVIDHSGPRVKIVTSKGTLSAAKVIVTVPSNLIAGEAIRFDPPLPGKVDAALGLPLGANNKVMLALSGDDDLPKDAGLRGAATQSGVGSFHLRPFGRPCIEGFYGGAFARELEDAGDGALSAQAIDEVVALLGSNYRSRLTPLVETRWVHDSFSQGAYSAAKPGHAAARAMLAAPVDGRLFFAGEATSPHFFSTAHGARDSGERAAGEVIAARTRTKV
ncbi:NAD(P)/FAD-dependent oxidoreductase [Tardiphaga sp.]|uniref:flavin monoamine oxidase family protein n=1 Tax=Tardiphaga sp. TaxID=1926292 RepID=UPI0026218769|nr:NAD(P)/FAD-dependent oxidoreductase [Tardiphaga sp.]MDB5618935.1 amine oxidase [Tardiphaga sp.]